MGWPLFWVTSPYGAIAKSGRNTLASPACLTPGGNRGNRQMCGHVHHLLLLVPTPKREGPGGHNAEKKHQENPACLRILFTFFLPVLPHPWSLPCIMVGSEPPLGHMWPLFLFFRAAPKTRIETLSGCQEMQVLSDFICSHPPGHRSPAERRITPSNVSFQTFNFNFLFLNLIPSFLHFTPLGSDISSLYPEICRL